MADNKYTIFITTQLAPKTTEQLQQALDGIGTKLSLKIGKVTIDTAVIQGLKGQIEKELKDIRVQVKPDVGGASSSARAGASATGGTTAPVAKTLTYETAPGGPASNVPVKQWQELVTLVEQATAGAKAKYRIDVDSNGELLKATITYNDLNNKQQQLVYGIREEINGENAVKEVYLMRKTLVSDEIAAEKQKLSLIEQQKKDVAALNEEKKKMWDAANKLPEESPARVAAVGTPYDTQGSALASASQAIDSYNQKLAEGIPLTQQEAENLKRLVEVVKEHTVAANQSSQQLEANNQLIEKASSLAQQSLSSLENRNFNRKEVQDVYTEAAKLEQMTEKYNDQVQKGTPLTKEQTAALRGQEQALKNANAALKPLSKDTLSFFSQLRTAIERSITWGIAMGALYGSIRKLREGIKFIEDLDNEMKKIQAVTGFTDEQIKRLAYSYNGLAKEMGMTTIEVAKGSLEFLRQGKTAQETAILLKTSMMMSKLAAMDSSQATEYLTSIMNGFKLEAIDMGSVLDKLVALDNHYATSVGEIASAMQRSAVSASVAGVSFDELASYITIVSSVTRKSSESIGESFKTMFARIQDVKLGKQVSQDGESISDVDATLKKYNITVLDSAGNMRDLGKIFKEVNVIWGDLGRTEQLEIGKAIAGTRQRENFLALMENFPEALKAQEIAANSNGLAQDRFGTILESTESKMNRLTAATEKLWMRLLDSAVIKGLIDLTTKFLEFMDNSTALSVAMGIVAGTIVAVLIPAIASLIASLGALAVAESMVTFGASAIIGILAAVGAGMYQSSQDAIIQAASLDNASTSVGKYSEQVIAAKNAVNEFNKTGKEIPTLEKALSDFEYLSSLTERTAKQEADWLALQIQLVAQLPEITWHYNEQHKLIIDSVDQVRQLVEGKKAENEATKEGLRLDLIGRQNAIKDKIIAQDEKNQIAAGVGKITKMTSEQVDQMIKLHDTANFDPETQALVDEAVGINEALSQLDAGVVNLGENVDDTTVSLGNFEDALANVYDGMIGNDKKFLDLANNLVSLNKSFKDGKISVKNYFDLMNSEIKKVNLNDIFGKDTESSQKFMVTMFREIGSALDQLNQDLYNGKITAADYNEGVLDASQSILDFSNSLLDNAVALGLTNEQIYNLRSSQAGLSDAIDASRQKIEEFTLINQLFGESFTKVMKNELQVGSAEYTNYVNQISAEAWRLQQEQLASFRDTNGQAFKSQQDIANYMLQNQANFHNISAQMATANGQALANTTEKVQAVISALGAIISGFKFTITPNIAWSQVDVFGKTWNIPTIAWSAQLDSTTGTEALASSIANLFSAPSMITPELLYGTPPSSGTSGGGGGGGGGGGSSAAASGQQQVNKKEEAYQFLLEKTIAMLKQKAEAQKKALKDELDAYKKIIDARKDILDKEKASRDFQKEMSKKNKDLANIEAELLQLQFDNSEEGKARRLELEQEKADQLSSIEDDQYNRSIDLQKEALDAEYSQYEDFINQKIEALDQYLSEEGTITQQAMDLLKEKGSAFYDELMEWNRKYGTGVDKDITRAWRTALGSVKSFSSEGTTALATMMSYVQTLAGQIQGLNNIYNNSPALSWSGTENIPTHHSGGIVGGLPKIREGEQFAKLLKGEVVANDSQMSNFMKRTLPSLVANFGGSGTINIEMPINVAGSLDKSVLPELKNMVTDAINTTMKVRGVKRTVNSFSV